MSQDSALMKRVAELDRSMDLLEARVTKLETEGIRTHLPVANDQMLDDAHGDQVVRHDPRDWKGQSFQGYRMSECPPDYLDLLAALFDWQAGKDELSGRRDDKGRLTAGWKRTDAARARGWAARKRTGWKPPPGGAGVARVARDIAETAEDAPFEEDEEDDIPF